MHRRMFRFHDNKVNLAQNTVTNPLFAAPRCDFAMVYRLQRHGLGLERGFGV